MLPPEKQGFHILCFHIVKIQTFVRYVFQIITSNIFKTDFPFTTKLYINNNRAKLGLIPPYKLHVTIHLLPFKLV